MTLLANLVHVVQQRGVACVAVIDGQQATPTVAWTPATLPTEPRFLAYSITKTFTAVLCLQLQAAGRLTLDDRLVTWFPEVPQAAEITLCQLLNHTAGIPDYGGVPAYYAAVRTAPTQAWTFAQYAAATYEKGLAFAPGTGWAYSNPGYMLLKRVIELVTDKAYATLIAEQITQPLGLQQTFVPEQVADLAALAPAPSQAISTTTEPLDTRLHYHPGWVSHGVIASTPTDIATFYHMLFTGRLLTPTALQAMTTLVRVPVEHAPWGEPSYGLGIMGDPASPVGLIWGHNGGGPGYNASAFHVPDLAGRPVTVCVMSAIEDGFDVQAFVLGVLGER